MALTNLHKHNASGSLHRLLLAAPVLLLLACDQNSSKTITSEPAAPATASANKQGVEPAQQNPIANARTTATVAPEPESIPAPADVAAAPASATKTASGLQSRVITPGTGKEHPTAADKVKVHYTGWTKDGKMFDSSIPRKSPTEFGLSEVIKGWTEGVQLMVVGEKRRFWIPAALAYGEQATMPGAPTGALTFDIELLEIKAAPKAPEDVAKAPASAKTTASGLAYRVLKAGTGKEHPAPAAKVTVHYSGWTPDGKLFDSSVLRGQPTSFPLNHVIPGWTEGVQLMVVGEKTRFWIPGKLAYGDGAPGGMPPKGPLVFDVELLTIE
jgi:FKBP-type peptidyl-prolyl cis-trans isomerase